MMLEKEDTSNSDDAREGTCLKWKMPQKKLIYGVGVMVGAVIESGIEDGME